MENGQRVASILGAIDLSAGALLPWAAALHAVALAAAVGIAIARAKGTVPPRARTVPIAAAAAIAGTLLLAQAVRTASDAAAALLLSLFGPLLAAGAVLLAGGLLLGLAARPWPTRVSATALALSLGPATVPLAFMSTPGAWPESRAILDAILNPTLLPLLLARAGAATLFCGTSLIAYATLGGDRQRAGGARAGAALSVGGAGALAGGAWLWLRAVGPAPLELLLDGSALPGAAAAVTRAALPAFAAVALLAAWIVGARPASLRPAAVGALALLATAAVGGAEVARVGLSGPWIVGAPGRGWLYASGLTGEESDAARRSGLAAVRPGIGPAAGQPSADRGGRIFGLACAPCHSPRSIGERLAGWPQPAIAAAVARLDRLSDASPPFPGDAADQRDVVLYLSLLDGHAEGTLPPPDPALAAEGARIFERGCAHCHREIRLERRVAGWCEPLAFDAVGRLQRLNPAMPRLDLDDGERRALAAYLVKLGAGGR